MPTPIHAPRVNNNDDTVRLSAILAAVGSALRVGDPIADVETDKATFTVESPEAGYLLAVNGKLGDVLAVGSILAWIGASPDESAARRFRAGRHRERSRFRAHAQSASHAETVRHLRRGCLPFGRAPDGGRCRALCAGARLGHAPAVAGSVTPFTSEERAMQRTVTWHRDEAVAGLKGLGLTLDPSHYICGPHHGDSYDQVFSYVYHVRLRDTSKDQLQVRVGRADRVRQADQPIGAGPLRPCLVVDILPIEGVDQFAEMRKMRLLLESLL